MYDIQFFKIVYHKMKSVSMIEFWVDENVLSEDFNKNNKIKILQKAVT